MTPEERIHAGLLDALHVHHARTGEIADPQQLAVQLVEAISDDLVRLQTPGNPYLHMVCDHEGHMIPHSACCPDRTTP